MNVLSRAITLALCICCTGYGALAQDIRGARIDLHPVKDQVGVVTHVENRSAWIRMPSGLAIGQKVSFLFYSDGGDTMAVGTVAWAAPIAPFEAYVTRVVAVPTRHGVDPYDNLDAAESLSRRTKRYGPRPRSEGAAVDLCAGMFASTAVAPAPKEGEALEPVRATLAALRTLKSNRTAQAMADAAARALPEGKERAGGPGEVAVDYVALADNLEPFSRLRIEDPILACLLRRLRTLAVENGGTSLSVSGDFLRSPGDASGNTPGRRQ